MTNEVLLLNRSLPGGYSKEPRSETVSRCEEKKMGQLFKLLILTDKMFVTVTLASTKDPTREFPTLRFTHSRYVSALHAVLK